MPVPAQPQLPAAQSSGGPTAPPARVEILKPESSPPPVVNRPAPTVIEPPKPSYSGPSSGTLVWSGQIEKGATVEIQADRASMGTLHGKLPGVPVSVSLDVREFAIAEAPGPRNNWSKLVIRSKNRRHTVITVDWKVLN